MVKEKLRKVSFHIAFFDWSLMPVQRDILGVILAIFGAVTIVGAGKSSDVRVSITFVQTAHIFLAFICSLITLDSSEQSVKPPS